MFLNLDAAKSISRFENVFKIFKYELAELLGLSLDSIVADEYDF